MKTSVSSEDRSVLNFSEIRQHAALFRFLSVRDVVVRYKQTMLGIGWSVIRPVINVAIFGVLSYLVDRSQNFADRFVMVAGGVTFWQLMSTTVTEVSNSLNNNANILTKVYFPKIILPLSSVFVCLIDFAIAFAIYLVLYLSIKGLPPWQIILLPIPLVFGMFFSMGFGLLFATASVRYRDVKFILPFVIQLLFYASPIVISTRMVLGLHIPEFLKTLYQLNPYVLIINGFNYCFEGSMSALYGTWGQHEMMLAGCSVLLVFLFVWIAIKYFVKFEQTIADYI